jgi:hypothetical protein
VIGAGLWRLPGEVALIAAIPESGRLAAAFLGLQIGRPVTDLPALLAGAAPAGRVLLVDDVCRSGATMAAARAQLAARFPGLPVTRLAVFCRAGAEAAVDLALAPAPAALVCEWSLFRSPLLARASFDLDGVLCADCPAELDDDGPGYRRFLATAAPQVVPKGPLRRIVTARLEKYRPETEAWLARHGIVCETLVMLDLPSDAERRRLRPQARFKAEAYRGDPGSVLFVESESWQAREIARRAGGKAVFDYQTRRLLDAAAVPAPPGPARRLAGRLARRLGLAGR